MQKTQRWAKQRPLTPWGLVLVGETGKPGSDKEEPQGEKGGGGAY